VQDGVCGLVVRVPGYRARGPTFDSWRYQVFWEIVGLERGPFSLVSTIEELLGRKSSGFGLEIREYSRKGSVTLTMRHPLSTKVVIIFTDHGCSVCIVRSRTKATEFFNSAQVSIFMNIKLPKSQLKQELSTMESIKNRHTKTNQGNLNNN
jgi:hypothetical protein